MIARIIGTRRTVAPHANIWLLGLASAVLLLSACGATQQTAEPTAAPGVPTAAAVETVPAEEIPPAAVATAPLAGTADVAEPTSGAMTEPTSAAMGTAEPAAGTAAPASGTAEPGAAALSVADIMSNPTQYAGQNVTVRGEVQQVLNNGALWLDEDAPLRAGIDNDLLVISAQQASPTLDDNWLDNMVEVQGTVRQYVKADFDRDYNWLQLQPEVEAKLENQPVLVANTVQPVTGGDLAPGTAATAGPIAGAPEGTLRVSDIVGDPATFTGKQVTVQGEAEEVYNTNALKLDDDAIFAGGIDNDLPVIGAQHASPTMDNGLLNSQVRVTGTVQMFDAATIGQQLGYDLTGDWFNAYEGKPVIVADSVEAVH